MRKGLSRYGVAAVAVLGGLLSPRVREKWLIKLSDKITAKEVVRSVSIEKNRLQIIFWGLLQAEIREFVLRESDREGISTFPRGLAVGDTLSHIHYTILKAQELNRKLKLLSPNVFPCNVYYRFLLKQEEYCIWCHPVYEKIALELNNGDDDFEKPGMVEKIHWDLALIHLIQAEQKKRNWEFPVYQNYNHKKDSDYANIGNEDFKAAYREFRSIAVFYDSEKEYLYRLIPERGEKKGEAYPGFSRKHLKDLKVRLGITKPYICLHLRANYSGVSETRAIEEPENYRPALEWLKAKGYEIVQMGTQQQHLWHEVEASWVKELVINYGASEEQGLFNDLHLVEGCEWMIGCCSGPTQFPFLFRKPTLWLNFVWLVGTVLLPENRFYPKNLYYSDGKPLSLEEHLKHPVFFAMHKKDYQKLGIIWKDLSEIQILEAVQEFSELAANPATDWKNRTDLQKNFLSKTKSEHLYLHLTEASPCHCALIEDKGLYKGINEPRT